MSKVFRWRATDRVLRPSRVSNGQFFAAVGLVLAAAGPMNALPLPSLPVPIPTPTPSRPVANVPIAAGVNLTAVDNAGKPLVAASFDVYRAVQPEGIQHPFLAVPVAASDGTAAVPLPAPSAVPDEASNYYAVSSGIDASGASYSGIEFFNLTAEHPVATATVSPNLFQVPVVVNQGSLPTPTPTGPCGFQPDVVQPPPPAFTITTTYEPDRDGSVDVGAVHGTGSFGGSSGDPQSLPYSPYQAMGESLDSAWARSTQSSVMFKTSVTSGETQKPWQVTGNLHFSLASSDIQWANHVSHAYMAGQGARRLVVAATWTHEYMTFHCTNPDYGPSETHEVFAPHDWNPHISTATPDVADTMDSQNAVESQTFALVFPNASNQVNSVEQGQSEVYEDGLGAGAGVGVLDADFSVYVQSTYSASNILTYYSAAQCGSTDFPTCFYWEVSDNQVTGCPERLMCGSDVYEMTIPNPSPTPNPGPQPCSKYAPHGGTC